MILLTKTIPPSGKTHSGTVIFFHGAGDTGSNMLEYIRSLLGKDIQFPHIKIVIPTAPLQSYKPKGGALSHVWFNRQKLSIDATECQESLAEMSEQVKDLIRIELEQGISPDRIIVGGFSMGGSLSLHIGYHINRGLGGVFACSSFLNNDSIVYESLRNISNNEKPPKLLMFHGDRDDVAPVDWGKRTFDQLTAIGVQGDFVTLKNTMHEFNIKQLAELQQWIYSVLPPFVSDLPHKL